jgi:cytochrome b subunit of formate dehydrogenase
MLLASFLGLAATGLPLKYSHSAWGKNLAAGLGGFSWTGIWHRFFAVTTFACLAMYVGLLAWRYFAGRRQGAAWQKVVFGPDSPVPTWRDVRDFFRMVRWFIGMGPKPAFERWSYWEKFDFWGACADIVIIGLTGLILWFPNFFCYFLPGVGLNIAKVIHSTQALLATGFVFAIHFFNTHLRPEKFPADMSVLSGLVSEEEMREERPELMERLAREGKLDGLRAVPSRKRLWLLRTYRILGFIALGLGLALLAGMVLVGMGG